MISFSVAKGSDATRTLSANSNSFCNLVKLDMLKDFYNMADLQGYLGKLSNDDQVVSATWATLLQTFDVNGDGTISKDEVMSVCK